MNKQEICKQLSVVIVTHNSESVIGKCLASIPKTCRILVVDNNSSDSTIDIIYNKFPAVELFKNKENMGFGRGNNLALSKVDTKYALLLNPDTVLQDQTLEKLIEVAEDYTNAAIISPALFLEDGTPQKSYKNEVFKREKQKSNYIEPEGDICASCLSGAVMLLRMECFKDIGFFDPNIFLFYEDDDLCLKARIAGYSLVMTPKAKVLHLMGQSSPATLKYIYLKNWHMMWSRLYIEKKYNGLSSSLILAFRQMFLCLFKSLAYMVIMNKQKYLKSWAKVVAGSCFIIGKKAC